MKKIILLVLAFISLQVTAQIQPTKPYRTAGPAMVKDSALAVGKLLIPVYEGNNPSLGNYADRPGQAFGLDLITKRLYVRGNGEWLGFPSLGEIQTGFYRRSEVDAGFVHKIGDEATGIINYSSNLSSTYTDRTLVDKGFVYSSIFPIVDKKVLPGYYNKYSYINATDSTMISTTSSMSYALSELVAGESNFFNKTSVIGQFYYQPTLSEGRTVLPDSVVIEFGIYKPTSSGYFFKTWGGSTKFSYIPFYKHTLTGSSKQVIDLDVSAMINFSPWGNGAYHRPLYNFTVPLVYYKNGLKISSSSTEYQSTNSADEYEFSIDPIQMGYCMVIKYYFPDPTDSLSTNIQPYIGVYGGTLISMQRVM